MAKKSSKRARKPLAPDEPAGLPAAVDPGDEPAQKLSEAMVAGIQAVKPRANATPARQPPHLLTPLATLWPMGMLPEPSKAPEKAPVAEKTPAPAAPQTVKVTFVLLDLGAKQVSLSGDFNRWATDATPMKRDDAGRWETIVALAPGRYEYKFVVDGEWAPDPLAHEHVWNQHGTLNSVVEVRV